MAKKVLKDINKDGKRNFKDTFLGDLLGVDGKLGVEKGNPRLGASMKGARREVPGEEKKPTTPTKSTTKTETRGATKESIGRTSMPVPKAKPEPKESTGRTSMKVPKAKPEPRESTGRTSMKVRTGTTYEQWKNMTRTERRDAGLPVSPIGGELAFSRFLSGITGEDYKIGGEAVVKKPKGVGIKRPPRPGFKAQTYAKGGMTKGSK
jgi:hypothetical protein